MLCTASWRPPCSPWYSSSISAGRSKTFRNKAEAQLTEVTRQYANAIKTDMRGNIQTVEAMAHVFGELGQSNPERSSPLITGAVATLRLKRMGFVTLDGMPTPPTA